MKIWIVALTIVAMAGTAVAAPKKPSTCARFHIDLKASEPLGDVSLPPDHLCTPGTSHGLDLPDRSCTPGAINPTVTQDILRNPRFTTKCVRDAATSAAQKDKTYGWYGITKPKRNTGKTQTCEKDHVISLGLGGADTLDNIFPQCGAPHAPLTQRDFKLKDKVELYLMREVKAGRMELSDAQHGIAEDWTQYLDAANAHVDRRWHRSQ
jgi:hypothetical protein